MRVRTPWRRKRSSAPMASGGCPVLVSRLDIDRKVPVLYQYSSFTSSRRMQMPATTANVKHLPANQGRSFAHLGVSISFKDEPGDNGDSLLMFECRMPAPSGVPPHTERNHEAFYVLEGTLEVEADGQTYSLGAGDFLGI